MTAALESVGATPASDFGSQGFAPTIPLHGRGDIIRAFVAVDIEDYEWASSLRWNKSSAGYAVRYAKVDGKQRAFYMHREILGLGFGDKREADHLNRIRLDNRRANLRVVTSEQNKQNVSSVRSTTSKYRGVVREGTGWRAYCKLNGKARTLGKFETEREAADAAARYREQHMPYSEEASA